MKQFKTILATLLILFAGYTLNAQTLYEIEMTEKDGTWQPISGGQYLTNGDDATGYFSLPFTFRLDNQNFTWGYVNCNGYLNLGYRSTYITSTPGYYYSGYNTIAWCNRDLYTYNGIYMKIDGSSPNRVATFQWNRVRIPYYTGSHYVNAQIKLYETSNKIEIIYGPQTGTPYNYSCRGWIGGRRVYRYGPAWVFRPGSPTVFQQGYPTAGWSTYWYTSAAWSNYLTLGKTYVYGKADPELVGTHPGGGEIYRKGAIYGGLGDEGNHPAVFIKRQSGQADVLVTYRIFGPVSSSSPLDVYRAQDGGSGSFEVDPGDIQGDSARYDFTVGTGVCFGTDGVLDFQTNQGSFSPGEYEVDAEIIIEEIGTMAWDPVRFNVALPWDVAITKIDKPRDRFNKKYPLSATPVEIRVANLGLNSATKFEVDVEIWDQYGNSVFTGNSEWEDTVDSLKTGEAVTIDDFGYFYPDAVGNYKLEASVTLLDAADQLIDNNLIPRAGDEDYYFTIAKEVDLKAVKIVYPAASDEVIVGRPIYPVARFTNQGVNDLDFDSIFYEIEFQNNEVVFRDTIINYVISAGARFDTTDVRTEKSFVPPYLGNYTICATIYSPYDENPISVRRICANFSVSAGLQGNYTIGSGTGDRNYPTIQDAVDDLYKYGVSGHVAFEFKDRGPYVIGDLYDEKNPALDLSGFIPGMGPDATVTFKPSNDRAVERGTNTSGVTIHVQTGSGYGILMGQNDVPNNPNAIVISATPSQKNKYATPNGYFIFDGGVNKSIRFVLKTSTDVDRHFQSVFYLRQGSKYNTIKNCIFENDYKDESGNIRQLHAYLPKIKSQGTQIIFMEDDYLPETSYSSAIALRTQSPLDKSGTNSYMMDTIPAHDNVIANNEISGFGYGIVDLGAGALLRQQHNEWTKYYNYNNRFEDNIIKNVARAGIFLGATNDEVVSGNRIYNVTGDFAVVDPENMGSKGDKSQAGVSSYMFDAAGIMAGGEKEDGWFGYNNMNLTITGNEISNVQSEYVAYGVKVEQVQTEYGSGDIFPDDKENTKVINNIIWGMEAKDNDPSISRIGIRVFTERTDIEDMFDAENPVYFTQDDRIINNTVIMPDDGGSTSGALAGIAVQHSKATKILNNAVAVEDDLFDASCPISSLIFYQGILPREMHGLESNRNAFWRTNPLDVNGASIYGFIELNAKGEFIDPANSMTFDQNAYETIRQWRNWTGEDMNSVYGDFTQDLEYTGTTVDYLRVKSPTPLGSILNDRGFRADEYLSDETSGYDYDALGNMRGVNGQLFDIGAQEFEGRMHLSDVEYVMISSPAAYQSGSGIHSDAEHVMTLNPVQLKVIVRNSGNLYQAGCKIRLEVTDLDVDTDMRYYDTVEADIVVSQSREVIFDLPATLLRTYADLQDLGFNPVIPARFNPSMKGNVTPRYNFKIEIQADENNANNYGETTLRFYLRQANNTLMMISADYTNTDVYNELGPVRSYDEIAGRINFDYLKDAFESVGWYPGIDRDIDHSGDALDSFKVDVFDRMAWEPKAVDYTMWKYVFWSDRDDDDGMNLNKITRYQQWDLADFLDAGTIHNKRNLVISSQEAVRNLDFASTDPNYDAKATEFVNNQLRSMYNGDGFAFGDGEDCHGKKLKGVAVGRDLVYMIERTGMEFDYGGTVRVDEPPYVGSVMMFTEGEGLAKSSFMYPEAETDPDMTKAGMSIVNMRHNVVYSGVDWRHIGDPENYLRSILDFYDKNGGTDVPIELSDFSAKSLGNKVEVRWTTVSEFNSSRFEVERAEMLNEVQGSFYKIAEKDAAGKSNIEREYGPVFDRNVQNGGTYVYRLRMVDLDGKYEYSDEQMVEVGGNNFWLGEASPNPAVNNVKFQITTGDNNVEVVVYDMNGRKVDAQYNINDGSIELQLNNYQSGLYTMLIKSGDLQMTRQFQVVK